MGGPGLKRREKYVGSEAGLCFMWVCVMDAETKNGMDRLHFPCVTDIVAITFPSVLEDIGLGLERRGGGRATRIFNQEVSTCLQKCKNGVRGCSRCPCLHPACNSYAAGGTDILIRTY